ncbi:uncharacterized protein LOC141898228 [Tubulanus polymorphus]|uniref:uncharacterized protein LOC141898228 n=1 Tax=Tubulanus polymorphus TaxID=672921 RepID=UPI003DA3B6AE
MKNPSGKRSNSRGNESKPEWFQELSEDQVQMFREVFELLDKDSGGSIDAEELYECFKDLDVIVTKDEIVQTMKELDKDGNGEIDFDEFLYCMAMLAGDDEEDDDEIKETDSGERHSRAYTKRQTLFFSAITKFAIKNSLGEIERYYAAKSRHTPHVISHYTAGARLIGLTDRQIERTLARFEKAAKGTNSPYAKPLHFVTPDQGKKKTKASEIPTPRPRYRRAALTGADDIAIMQKIQEWAKQGSVVARLPNAHLIPQIRTKIANGELDENTPVMSSRRKRARSSMSLKHNDAHGKDKRKDSAKKKNAQPGWSLPTWARRPESIPLPMLSLNKGTTANPTIEDLPIIRQKVSKAVNSYYSNLRKRTVAHALQHWGMLYPGRIPSEKLLKNFLRVYRAYSPHKEEETFVICPWIPGTTCWHSHQTCQMQEPEIRHKRNIAFPW